MFRMMRSFLSTATVTVLVIGVPLALPTTAGAQIHPPRWSADSILVQFERDGGGLRLGYVQAMRVLDRPSPDLATTRDSVLGGLERLALSATNPPVRTAAALTIMSAASEDRPRPVPEVVTRLTRIYTQTSDPAVRSVMRGIAWRLADKPGALRLMRLIVLAEDSVQARRPLSNFDDASAIREAIENLARFSPEGRATLADLHRGKRLRSYVGKERLEHLARRNFEVERQP